jgi:hypothetical protein
MVALHPRQRGQREALQDLQRLRQHQSARGGQRSARDARVAVGERGRLALDHAVAGEILQLPDAAAALHAGDQPLRHAAGIEPVAAPGRERFQGGGELGLAHHVARLGHLSIVQKDARDRGVGLQLALAETGGQGVAAVYRKTVARQPDRRCERGRQR